MLNMLGINAPILGSTGPFSDLIRPYQVLTEHVPAAPGAKTPVVMTFGRVLRSLRSTR